MSFSKKILNLHNYLPIPRPILHFFGCEETIFLMTLCTLWEQVVLQHPKKCISQIFFNSTIIKEQIGMSLYRQNRILEGLCELHIIQLIGKTKSNKRIIRINFDLLDVLMIKLYKNKEKTYSKIFKDGILKFLRMKTPHTKIFKDIYNKTKETNKIKMSKDISHKKVAGIDVENSLLGKDNSFITRHAEKLQRLLKLRSQYKPVTIATWSKHINYLICHQHISPKRYARVIRWFFKNKDTYDYCPQIRKATDLVDKFLVIEQMMKKQNKVTHPEDSIRWHNDPDPRKEGYYDDSLGGDE